MESNFNYDLKSYMKIYNILDTNEVSIIVKELEQVNWQTHYFYSYGNKENDRVIHDDEFVMSWHPIPSKGLLMERVWKSIALYFSQLNFSWFSGWSGFTDIRFNKYLPGKSMHAHCDHIRDIFDGDRKGIPTLSVLGMLENDCVGGDLLFFDEQKYKIPVGSVMIFPSNFLYPHSVTEIIEGRRISFVTWVW